jgi:hypothetical protein
MAATNEFTYPYNPNGVLDECKITGEAHTITPGTSASYNWFIPDAAPFFGFSVVLKHVASGRTLQRGVDYNLGLEYHQFNTQVTLRPVYAAIILIDTSLTGAFTMDYMTIGGQYAIDHNKALEYMANAAIDPRSTQWDSVTDIPPQFPVSQHLHDASDIIGMSDVVTAINALTTAMLSGGGKWFQSLNEHLNDFNDPHHVLEMIPGDGGQAIPKASQQQAIDGVDNAAYMTALRVAQYCAANILTVIDAHIGDKNNPHDVDKAGVGLALVQNLGLATTTDVDGKTNLGNYVTLEVVLYAAQMAINAYTATYNQALATQSEAETGVNNTHWMSPLRVAQFVAKGVGQALQNHIDATGNVHGLTAKDINLENLINVGQATQTDVDATAPTSQQQQLYINLAMLKYAMSKINTSQFLTSSAADTKISTAMADIHNYPIASLGDSQSGDKLATPALVSNLLQSAVGSSRLGVCENAADRAAYLGQTVVREAMVDVVAKEVYTYQEDTATWTISSSKPADILKTNGLYFNTVAMKGFFCTNADGNVVKVTDSTAKVTVSNSTPPTDTTGYVEGHVWYQIS